MNDSSVFPNSNKLKWVIWTENQLFNLFNFSRKQTKQGISGLTHCLRINEYAEKLKSWEVENQACRSFCVVVLGCCAVEACLLSIRQSCLINASEMIASAVGFKASEGLHAMLLRYHKVPNKQYVVCFEQVEQQGYVNHLPSKPTTRAGLWLSSLASDTK